MVIITILLFLIFLSISIIHFYWAFGGKRFSGAVVPTKDDTQPLFVPGAISTFIVAIGLLCFGIFYVIKYGFIKVNLPILINQFGFWFIASIFIVRAIGDFNYVGFFKKYKSSKFAINDTKYYSPLCLLIGILTLILEISN